MGAHERASLRRGSLAAFAASVGGVVVGLFISVVVARSIGPAGKGSYDIALATAGLLSLGLGLSLPGGISYAVAQRSADPRRLRSALLAFAFLQVLLSIAILLVGLRLAPDVVGTLSIEGALTIAALVGLMSLLANLRAILIGIGEIVTASWLDLASRVLTAIVLIGLLAVARLQPGGVTFETLLWASVASAVVASALAWLALVRARPREPGRLGWRPIAGFALPAHLGNLVQYLNYRLDLFLVTAFAGLAATGVYALAVSFAQMVWLAPGAIALAVLPRVASEGSEGASTTDIPRISRLSLLISIAAAVALAVAAPTVIDFLYGPRFSGGAGQLLLLLPGVAVFGQATVLAAYIGGRGRQRLNLYIALVALAVTIALDIALIPPMGGAGAAIASTLSYATTSVLTLVAAARLGPFTLRDLSVPRRTDLGDLGAGVARLAATMRREP